VGDNCCSFNYNALSAVVPEHAILVHADFSEAVCITPWALYIDHELQSVIVAVRGSLSLGDVLTDLLAVSENLGTEWWYIDVYKKSLTHRTSNTVLFLIYQVITLQCSVSIPGGCTPIRVCGMQQKG
jgi:hypothetical protein